jgi:hypothetical protein
VWINRYSKYWQSQFDTLAAWLDQIERRKQALAKRRNAKRHSLTKE